jgi:biotin carboxyl carrier protein
MHMSADGTFERIIEYFQSSRFEYLALDYAGGSLRLARNTSTHAAATRGVELRAPTVGFVQLPDGRARFPEAGDPVSENEVLFAVRRFRNAIPVTAAASGAIGCVRVSEGDFVEFGQPLATIEQTK